MRKTWLVTVFAWPRRCSDAVADAPLLPPRLALCGARVRQGLHRRAEGQVRQGLRPQLPQARHQPLRPRKECCPGCTPVDKPPYGHCDCSKGPPPGPPPGNDTWTNYSVGPLAVTAVTGGKDASAYDTAVVMLHGGGGSGTDWLYQYDAGWLGNLTGFKYVFPTSAYTSHVWFQTFKAPGCGLDDDCAYNKTSIAEAAGWVEALIEHEASLPRWRPQAGVPRRLLRGRAAHGLHAAGSAEVRARRRRRSRRLSVAAPV